MTVAARIRADPRVVPALVALLALAAYLPSLSGGFVSDDARFIVDNEAVHELSPARAWSYFANPEAQATVGHDIYRPLRTLGFAIDWTVSGGSPLFFRIRSLAWFVALSLLALYRRLEPDGGRSSPRHRGRWRPGRATAEAGEIRAAAGYFERSAAAPDAESAAPARAALERLAPRLTR